MTEKKISPSSMRTMYNWMMDPAFPSITVEAVQKLLNDGKIPKDEFKTQLIPYSSLQAWGVV
jgi:hypothetical protein